MQINITSKNCDLSEQSKQYTHKKLEKLRPHEDIITSIAINYHTEKLEHIAEGHISLPGNTINARAEHKTSQGAMDGLIDKLVRLVVKHKEKQTSHR